MSDEPWTPERLAGECRRHIEGIKADPEALARLPAEVRTLIGAEQPDDQPWTIERLRNMSRREFQECVKRGDIPPADLASELIAERLSLAAKRRAMAGGVVGLNPYRPAKAEWE